MRWCVAFVCLGTGCGLHLPFFDDGPDAPPPVTADAAPRIDGPGTGSCPGAPAGVSPESADVHDAINATRIAMGVPCGALVPALNVSSEKHCAYWTANKGTPSCVADPHAEVPSCLQFVAARFDARERLAGYAGTPAFEVMAFGSTVQGLRAMQIWADSVWHRTPLFSPWVRDMGFGQSAACATMDFGRGAASSADLVVTYPYPDQTGVPPDFDGSTELPTPDPNLAWPSGYPITLYVQNGSFADPTLTVDGSATAIDHVWITPQSSGGLLEDAYVILPKLPLRGATRYRVRASGSNGAGAVSLDFTFTTK
ncbi:MAG TPA: hypothetical protein VKE22_10385 [Haliangiales bacterium]|nr:hypothetical protein [Haliangiales bacterium]